MRPVLHVIWVDEALHDLAMTALLVAGRRGLSLVDWVGFTVMRQHGITEAFAFDDDFADQGFTLIPRRAVSESTMLVRRTQGSASKVTPTAQSPAHPA